MKNFFNKLSKQIDNDIVRSMMQTNTAYKPNQVATDENAFTNKCDDLLDELLHKNFDSHLNDVNLKIKILNKICKIGNIDIDINFGNVDDYIAIFPEKYRDNNLKFDYIKFSSFTDEAHLVNTAFINTVPQFKQIKVD